MEGNFWTIRDIAADPRVALTPGSLRAGLNQKEYPPLVRDYSLGPTSLYLESTVEAWIEALLKWRAESPARAAAKRAEAQRRLDIEQAAEAERYRILKHMGDCAQATQDSLLEQIDEMNRTGAYRL